jgi:hypothetical protein
MLKIFFMSIILLVVVFSCKKEQRVSAQSGESYPEFTSDGAWCWFQDPRAVYVEGKHKCTYAGWITRDGKLQVGSYDHETGIMETCTLKEQWGSDDHNTNTFLVLPDKRLMVFYAQHNGTGLYCRTTKNPEDISAWEAEDTVASTPRITYSHPVYLSEEDRYYVFWRGESWKPTFAWSSDTKNWSEPQILVQEQGREARNIRPYTKIVSDGHSVIHIAFTDGHPNVEPQNCVYYLKYKGGAIYKANGEKIGDINNLPISPVNCDLVYDAKKTNIRAWVWDISIDKNGYPIIAYTRFPSEKDHRYHYARWSGSNWLDNEIKPSGPWFPQTPEGKKETETYYSGGMALNQSNTNVVYLSRQVNGVFEIEKWATSDGGNSWIPSPITKDSQHLNVRPVFPRGYAGQKDHLLWMNGDYIYFTDFATSIRMMLP